jgi:hypothetical protein
MWFLFGVILICGRSCCCCGQFVAKKAHSKEKEEHFLSTQEQGFCVEGEEQGSSDPLRL